MNEKVEGVNEKVEVVNEKVEGVNEKVERLVAAREEMKKEVKGVKENLSKVNKDVDEVKVMMSQMLEKLNMIELFNKLPSPTEGMMNTSRRRHFDYRWQPCQKYRNIFLGEKWLV